MQSDRNSHATVILVGVLCGSDVAPVDLIDLTSMKKKKTQSLCWLNFMADRHCCWSRGWTAAMLLGLTGRSLPQPFFSVTAITVRENGGNRHERLSVTVTVRVEPSGIDRQGKWSFPDGKPSVTIS